MVIQMRPQGGGVPYAPARDIALFFDDIVRDVARRLELQWFAPLHKWLHAEGISEADLGEACQAYMQYLLLTIQEPDLDIEETLRRAGWFGVPAPAQVAYMFYLGQCVSGCFFCGLRDTTYGNESRLSIQQMRWYALRARLLLSLSPWRRWWYLRLAPYRRWLWRTFKLAWCKPRDANPSLNNFGFKGK